MRFFTGIFEYRITKCFILLCLLVLISLSLSTYSAYDVSFNTASKIYPSNILGRFGSYTADTLVQYVGYSSWVIVFSLLCLVINLARKADVTHLKVRVLASLICSIIFGLLISISFPNYAASSHKLVINILSGATFEIKIAAKIGLVIFGLIFFFYSLGIPFKSYLNFLSSLSVAISFRRENKTTPPITSVPRVREIKMSAMLSHNKTVSEEEEEIFPIANKEKGYRSIPQVAASDSFELPSLDLLSNIREKEVKLQTQEELEAQGEELLKVLNEFGVKGSIIEINQGPVVTLYEFEPAPGTKSSRVISLADDIARTLCAVSARIAVIPGRNVLGIELPNKQRQFFRLRELFESNAYADHNLQLPIVLGKDLGGKPCVVDLAKMPHLLVAGTTGSGKSVAVNAMIISLLYRHTPEQCKFIMIDPKMLELSVYDGIPHLLSPVVTEPGKAVVALKWAVREMENRYRLMSNVGVRNIHGYNSRILEAIKKGEELKRTVQTGFDLDTGKPIFESVAIEMVPLPFIVIIVDEMADLMLVAGKDIESSIQRLAQMARAAGIHLIMATQRPSVDVITGVIKANFPSRVSFKVTSKIDSRTILGEQGAEQLLGMGDMLYMGNSSKIMRVHGPFVEDGEVERISQFLKMQASPEYVTSITTMEEEQNPLDAAMIDGDDTSDDGLYRQALQIVKQERKASTSYIQRCLRIGYNRAAILVERMEKEGVLSAPNSMGKREILLPEE